MSRVILAMSGGVDSSVAAWLLRRQGHDVIGLFMRHGQAALESSCETPHGSPDSNAAAERPSHPPLPNTVRAAMNRPHKQGCCSAFDAADARRVADALGIPFYAVNFEEQFGRIVDYFVAQYTAGRTPNPCVVCNTWLKFGKLFDYADSVGAEFVATGHYARLLPSATATPALCRGVDPRKDQSYVLFGIARNRLARMLLPVGEYNKEQIRGMAAEVGMRVADKPDSQEICFVPEGDHAAFVRRRRGQGDTSGEIVTSDGTVVGRHDGLEQFTIGQRKGLGIAFGEPRYVVRLEAATRQVVIGTKRELGRSELTARDANWLIDPPTQALPCQVKIRYRSRPVPSTVEPLEGDRFRVCFHELCEGVAPGQAAVCYDGDRVLGGGWIE